MERIRNEIAERDASLQELGRKGQKTTLTEEELDEEIRNLQAGEERRGNCASQSNGCCFDPAVVEAAHHDGSNTGMAADPSSSRRA